MPSRSMNRAVAQERKKIVVAYVAASEQMIIPALAQQTGIFHKHGLDAQVVLVSGSPRNVQSLIAGNFDYTMAGVTPLIRVAAERRRSGDLGGDRELFHAENHGRAHWRESAKSKTCEERSSA